MAPRRTRGPQVSHVSPAAVLSLERDRDRGQNSVNPAFPGNSALGAVRSPRLSQSSYLLRHNARGSIVVCSRYDGPSQRSQLTLVAVAVGLQNIRSPFVLRCARKLFHSLPFRLSDLM